jgi:signal transduction histidine kinase/CheY-like chemotaxis protein
MTTPLILVADDSRDVTNFLRDAVLAPAGYRVSTAGDGLTALNLAEQLNPDLVITDHNMPNVTGVELTRRLKAERPRLPIILITGEGSDELAQEARRAGACAYFTKPFDIDALLGTVARALEEADQAAPKGGAGAMDAEAEALSLRLRQLETLAHIGRTVTAMLDLDEILTTVVEAAVRLTEAEEGSLLLLDDDTGELYMRSSKNFDEDFASTFRLRTQDSLAGRVIATGEPVLLDERSPQKIKTSYLVHSLLYVPLRARGKTIGVLGVDNRRAGRTLSQEDVTVMSAIADYAAIAIDNARLYQKTEADLRKLETVLTQTEDAVVVVDTENRLLIANRTACEAFGVNGIQIGQSVVESFDDPGLLGLIRAPGSLPRREEIETGDGRIFNAQRTPIPGVGQAVVMQDITHLKELDRIKSEFVTTVSHDLRSPLTAILGYVELIDRCGPVNDQQEEFIRRVKVSVEHITALISDLLDLGRIEAGIDGARQNVQVEALLQYALEGLQGALDTHGLKVVESVPPVLPPVPGDPIRLRQMIGNLLENAIKYSDAGGEIGVSARVDQDQLILQVTDHGRGIPPADQPYLFDRFFRAGNVTEDTSGTGLGLAIVKSIVDHHDGRIWVDSALGKGSVFTVVLPIAES